LKRMLGWGTQRVALRAACGARRRRENAHRLASAPMCSDLHFHAPHTLWRSLLLARRFPF
jgi:hypothetical protein